MTLRDSEIQNDIDSGIAENRFDAYWANPEFARTALGIFWNNVSTADDSELGKSRLQVRGTDVTCANDSNVFGSWFEHFWGRRGHVSNFQHSPSHKTWDGSTL